MGKRMASSRTKAAKLTLGNVAFLQPPDWQLEASPDTDADSMTLQGPGASFAILAAFPADADPERIVIEAIDTLREEHASLELEDIDDDFESQLGSEADAYGQEAAFFSIDTLVYCWLRAWRLSDATAFVMLQSTDAAREDSEAVFQGLCRSASMVR